MACISYTAERYAKTAETKRFRDGTTRLPTHIVGGVSVRGGGAAEQYVDGRSRRFNHCITVSAGQGSTPHTVATFTGILQILSCLKAVALKLPGGQPRSPDTQSQRHMTPCHPYRWFCLEIPEQRIVFRHDDHTVIDVHNNATTDVRSPMATDPGPRPRHGDAHASPAIPEIQQIGRELSALRDGRELSDRRNADLVTDTEFTWLD